MQKTRPFRMFLYLAAVTAIVSLYTYLNPARIDQTLSARICSEGVTVGQTTITIRGEARAYLTGENTRTFAGTFAVDCLDQTAREGTEAQIRWDRKTGTQAISYYYRGSLTASDVESIVIDGGMTELAILLADGTIIATSDAALWQLSE